MPPPQLLAGMRRPCTRANFVAVKTNLSAVPPRHLGPEGGGTPTTRPGTGRSSLAPTPAMLTLRRGYCAGLEVIQLGKYSALGDLSPYSPCVIGPGERVSGVL